MAVIGTIRKQSGLLVIIIGVALAAFVLGDFFKSRNRGRQQEGIANVMGEDISYSYFDTKYEQNLEGQKRQQKKDNFTAEELFRIRQQTYDQIINQLMLKNEYDKLGLIVSSDELFDQIQGENPHRYILQYFKDPQTQKYDPELVRNYLKKLDQMDPTTRKQWDDFVQAIDDDRYSTKYKNLITKGYFMPDTFLVMDYNQKKTIAKIAMVGVKFSSISDSTVDVTDADLEKYYEEYKYNYEQEESRDLDYVVFNVVPSTADRKKIRDDAVDVFKYFKESTSVPMFVNTESENRYDSTFFKKGELPVRLDSVMFNSEPGTFVSPYLEDNQWHMAKLMDVQYRPDSMKASHILLSYKGACKEGENVTRSKEDAKKLDDSLQQVLASNSSKLEELAKTYSDDPSAAEKGGDLGWFADGAMVYPINQAVLSHKAGEVTIAESQFGYHVIKVTGKKEPVKKVRVAIIDIAITPSEKTFQDVYAKASEFQGKAVSLEAFDTLATNMNLSKRNAQYLQAMSNRIAGIDAPRPIVQWMYTDGLEEGAVSRVFTMEDKYVVGALTKIREKGIPSMEEIRETLEPLVRNELKGDKIVEEMKEALAKSQDLSKVANQLGAKVDTVDQVTFSMRNVAGFGNESNLVAKALTMEAGQTSDVIKGNNAAFIATLLDLQKPAPMEDNKIYRNQMLMNFRAKVNNSSYLQSLKKNIDIKDNRVKYF